MSRPLQNDKTQQDKQKITGEKCNYKKFRAKKEGRETTRKGQKKQVTANIPSVYLSRMRAQHKQDRDSEEKGGDG